MPDKTKPPGQYEPIVSDTNQIDGGNNAGEGSADPRQDIFDARFATLTDGFGKACEQEKVDTAICIAIHPDQDEPIIFIRGHEYDVAALLASVSRHLNRKLLGPLTGNPDYES